MKRLAITTTLLLLTFGVGAHVGEEKKGPQMTFEVVNFDFGTLEQGGQEVAFDFEFTNDGTAPLIITQAKNSCRCIAVEFPKRPVRVGEGGTVRVTFDPKDKGVFNKAIEIHSNIPGGYITLFVTGEVR